RQSARDLVTWLSHGYGLEQAGRKGYKPAALIQATLEHVASPDHFLKFFVSYIYEELCPKDTTVVDFNIDDALSYFDGLASRKPEQLNNLKEALEKCAEYIVENFLLPLRASSVKTPQPTPTSLSSLQSSTPTGTRQRVSVLRQSCLVRDRHRCVVTRKFDRAEAKKRFAQNGEFCTDDDDNLLRGESSDQFQFLEVAHILPHCLTTIASGETDLSDSKKNVLRILDMFDPGIGHLIDGPKIDSPSNAITLTLDYHRLFGEFQIYFQSTGIPHQYRIDSTEQSPFLRDPLFPVTRDLTLSPNHTIDPPSSRLLDVHRAIALILKLSGAGEYIERVLRDMEQLHISEDGSTNLGSLAGLRLGGWLTLSVH
ncbi:uncharacterized protein N7511_011360, partial [Penicillium nucicola]|uniref:uncharacterized protein n=1 Tax=Penicillium nucicola TaxID=1850975 RepID=UPI00254536AC